MFTHLPLGIELSVFLSAGGGSTLGSSMAVKVKFARE